MSARRAAPDAPDPSGRLSGFFFGGAPSPQARYAGAAALSACAVAAAWALHATLGALDVLLLLAAVTAASLRGGTGAGLFSAALCALGYGALHGARSAAWLEEPDPVHRLVFFVGFAAIDVWVAAGIAEAWRHSHARRRTAERRAQEHAVAAELGVRALAEGDIDALLEQTLAAVQATLRCDSVTLVELADDGDGLVLRKAAGLGRDLVGTRFSPADAKLAFTTIARREALAIEDLRARPDIASPVLLENGIVSSATAPIGVPGPGGRSLGSLGAHWRARRALGEDELSFLQTTANVVGTAVVRLQGDARLRHQFDFLRAIATSLAEGVFALDREGRFTFVNDAALRMIGGGDLAGRALADVARARGASAPTPAEEAILGVAASGRPARAQDAAFVRADGSAFPVAYTASPLWRDGEVVGAVVAFQDFSEHVRAEEHEKLLAEASRQLALTLDLDETLARVARLALPVLGDWSLVVLRDDAGRPRSVTTAAADPRREQAARELLDRYPIDPDAAHGVGRILRTGESELIPEVGPQSFVDARGGELALRREILDRIGLRSYVGAPLEARGRVLGAIAFGISDDRRRFGREDLHLVEELARRCAVAIDNASLYRAAQVATRARDEVLAVVSHDLQTPLGTLLLGAGMVEKLAPAGDPGEPLRRAAATVRRSGNRMRRLVEDLVDLASLDAGRLSIRLGAHDAAAIAREAVEAASTTAAEYEVAVAVDAVPAALACDRDRVGQVLANLLANALRVTPPGGRVTVRAAPGDGEVVFMVTDTGPGIGVEEQPHLFERWYRGRDVGYVGHGLGLAIARGLVEAHGGRIWVESTPGAGATFAFALPRGTGVQRAAVP